MTIKNEIGVTGDKRGGVIAPGKEFKMVVADLTSAIKDVIFIANKLHKWSSQKKYVAALGEEGATKFSKNIIKVKAAANKVLPLVKAAKDSTKGMHIKATVSRRENISIDTVITKLKQVDSAGKVQVIYRVIPKQFLKERRYKDLNKMTQEFSKEELKGASITVVINTASVGKLDTEKVLDELYT